MYSYPVFGDTICWRHTVLVAVISWTCKGTCVSSSPSWDTRRFELLLDACVWCMRYVRVREYVQMFVCHFGLFACGHASMYVCMYVCMWMYVSM